MKITLLWITVLCLSFLFIVVSAAPNNDRKAQKTPDPVSVRHRREEPQSAETAQSATNTPTVKIPVFSFLDIKKTAAPTRAPLQIFSFPPKKKSSPAIVGNANSPTESGESGNHETTSGNSYWRILWSILIIVAIVLVLFFVYIKCKKGDDLQKVEKQKSTSDKTSIISSPKLSMKKQETSKSTISSGENSVKRKIIAKAKISAAKSQVLAEPNSAKNEASLCEAGTTKAMEPMNGTNTDNKSKTSSIADSSTRPTGSSVLHKSAKK